MQALHTGKMNVENDRNPKIQSKKIQKWVIYNFKFCFVFFLNYAEGFMLQLCQKPGQTDSMSRRKSAVPPQPCAVGDANRAGSSSHTSVWFCLDRLLNFTFIAFGPEMFQGSPPRSLNFCSNLKARQVLPSI